MFAVAEAGAVVAVLVIVEEHCGKHPRNGAREKMATRVLVVIGIFVRMIPINTVRVLSCC